MANINLEDFKALYLSTAHEYVQKMKKDLSELVENPSSKEALNELHLSSHSLKSQSLVMGYTTTGELSHSIERFARALKDKNVPFPVEHGLSLEKVTLALDSSIQKIENEGIEEPLSSTINEFESVITNL